MPHSAVCASPGILDILNIPVHFGFSTGYFSQPLCPVILVPPSLIFFLIFPRPVRVFEWHSILARNKAPDTSISYKLLFFIHLFSEISDKAAEDTGDLT
jgi:hypothetical protein